MHRIDLLLIIILIIMIRAQVFFLRCIVNLFHLTILKVNAGLNKMQRGFYLVNKQMSHHRKDTAGYSAVSQSFVRLTGVSSQWSIGLWSVTVSSSYSVVAISWLV